MTIRALLFDFDGVITDTEPIHMEAWLAVLEPLGISFGEEEWQEYYIGLNDREFLDVVAHRHHLFFDPDKKNDLGNAKEARYRSLLEHRIPLLPGVAELLPKVTREYKTAIVSGSRRSDIHFILKQLGWQKMFKLIIAAEQVTKGKPDPEGYIRAVEGLSKRYRWFPPLEAGECLAIEDSPRGIQAAKAAGLKCLAISTSREHRSLQAADWISASLADLNLVTQEVSLVPATARKYGSQSGQRRRRRSDGDRR